MTDPTADPHPGDTDVGIDRESPPGTPRWVKVFGVAFLLLVLMIIVMMASGHGPGRHFSGASIGSHVPAFTVTGQMVSRQ